jgi:hypothetical protein
MFETDLERNLRAMQSKQQEDRQWKEDVLSVLISIDEKLDKVLETKVEESNYSFHKGLIEYADKLGVNVVEIQEGK